MIELQKKYARDLLTHVNPYTGNPYTREPAVAFVEINNENALHATWGEGKLDQLPEPYATTYRNLWNGWLKQKYGTTEQLRKAWNAGAVPLGSELLRNGHFTSALGESLEPGARRRSPRRNGRSSPKVQEAALACGSW